MIITPGDISDLLTIAKLKKDRLPSKAHEFRYKEILERWNEGRHSWEEIELLLSLYDINRRIWDLEADIRNARIDDLEEIGRRALEIRDLNRNRIEHKNLINEYYGIEPEIKIDHASEKNNNDNNDKPAD